MYKINKMKRIKKKKKRSVRGPVKSCTFDTFNHLPLDGFFRPGDLLLNDDVP